MVPTSRSGLTTGFFLVPTDPRLELGAEMADEALKGPGEGFA